MPYVECSIVIDAPARRVYELAKDQERFPQFMPDVETVTVLERRAASAISRWKTLVEEAPIEWTEEDRFDDAALRIDYQLIEGDLDKFEEPGRSNTGMVLRTSCSAWSTTSAYRPSPSSSVPRWRRRCARIVR